MFNTVELLAALQVMKFHVMDYRTAIKTDVYKEIFKTWKDVYITRLCELWSFHSVCAAWSQSFLFLSKLFYFILFTIIIFKG